MSIIDYFEKGVTPYEGAALGLNHLIFEIESKLDLIIDEFTVDD